MAEKLRGRPGSQESRKREMLFIGKPMGRSIMISNEEIVVQRKAEVWEHTDI